MKRKYMKKNPIEQEFKKYAVNALQEDHVRVFSRKKDPCVSKTSTNLKLQIKPTCGI